MLYGRIDFCCLLRHPGKAEQRLTALIVAVRAMVFIGSKRVLLFELTHSPDSLAESSDTSNLGVKHVTGFLALEVTSPETPYSISLGSTGASRANE